MKAVSGDVSSLVGKLNESTQRGDYAHCLILLKPLPLEVAQEVLLWAGFSTVGITGKRAAFWNHALAQLRRACDAEVTGRMLNAKPTA